MAGSYAITLAGSVGMIVLTLFTGVLSARLLSPDGRGAVGAIAGWVMVVTVVSSLGFREGMSWIQAKSPERGRDVLAVSVVSIFVTSALGIAVAELLIPLGFSAQSDEVVRYAQIFMLWVIPYSACYSFTTLFGARQRFVPVTLMRVGQPALYAVGLVGVWIADAATVLSVLVLQVVSFVVPAVIGFASLARESGVGRVDRGVVKRGFSYGVRAFGSTFGFLANSRLDLMILPAVVLTDQIGLYVVAVSAGSMIVGLFGSLRVVVFPAAARLGGAEAVAVSQRALRVVFLASAATALVLAAAAGFLVELLYGADFSGAVTPLRFLLPGIVCWATAQIATSGLKGIGNPTGASIAQFAGVGVTVIGLALFLGDHGIRAAALVSSASYFTVLVVSLVFFARSSQTRIRDTVAPDALVADVRWTVSRVRGVIAGRRGAGAGDDPVVGPMVDGAELDSPDAVDLPSESDPIAEERTPIAVDASGDQPPPATPVDASSAPRHRPPSGNREAMVTATSGLAAAVLCGLAAAYLASGQAGDTRSLVLVMAAPVAASLGMLAVIRFEWFVLAVLFIRPSLDGIAPGGIGPGAMVAALFVTAATLWLIVQYREGQWRPLSLGSKCLVAVAGATLIATVTSEMRFVSAAAAIEIFAGICMFLVLEQLIAGDPQRVRRLVITLLAGGVIPLLVGTAQWLGGDITTARTDLGRVQATFVHPNPFATYLVMLILLGLAIMPLTLRRSPERWLLAGYLVMLGLMLVVTYNRASWMAFIVGVAYLAFKHSRALVVAFAIVLVLIGTLVPSVSSRITDLSIDRTDLPEDVPDNSLEWRLQYWELLVPLANESPVTGLGPQVILNSRPEELEPHNVYVQIYVEQGLLGLGALAAAVVGIGITLRRRRRWAQTRAEVALATGAIAVGLAIFTQAPSENLLHQTMAWWYFAACATWGGWRSLHGDDGGEPDDGAAGNGGRTLESTRSVAG
ncbi:MAG: O-antigen ligase family protein [Actinomycetota bacterium]